MGKTDSLAIVLFANLEDVDEDTLCNYTGTFDGQHELRCDGYERIFSNSKCEKFHFEF